MKLRAPVVATALAIAAAVLAAIALVVVMRRSGERVVVVSPDDLLRLESGSAMTFDDQGAHVRDPQLAAALGLAPDDAIVSLSGVRLRVAYSARRLIGMHPAEVFARVAHGGGESALVRWTIEWPAGSGTAWSQLPSPPSQPSGPPGGSDVAQDQIERVDDMHVRVPRSVVEQVLANPAAVSRQVRVVPAMRDGDVVGIKLFGIRPSSLVAALGFENGDTVREVNGHALASADDALAVYSSLRTATVFVVDLDRRGAPATLTIDIN